MWMIWAASAAFGLHLVWTIRRGYRGAREAHFNSTAEHAPATGRLFVEDGCPMDVLDKFLHCKRAPIFPKTEHVVWSTSRKPGGNPRKVLHPPPRRKMIRRIQWSTSEGCGRLRDSWQWYWSGICRRGNHANWTTLCSPKQFKAVLKRGSDTYKS